jgi:hypothetical protein
MRPFLVSARGRLPIHFAIHWNERTFPQLVVVSIITFIIFGGIALIITRPRH